MIRVVIDTNNLPINASQASAAFKRLLRLIEENVIEVLMPHVVAEEWRTQRRDHLRKQFQKTGEALKDVVGGGHLDGHGGLGTLVTAATTVDDIAADVEAISSKALQRLVEVLHTEVLPIGKDHGVRVMAAYFKGTSPFSGVKARKDLPDAFVYEAAIDLAVGGPVTMVTADGNLRKHLSQLPAITCMETLEQFVESEQVKEVTAQIEIESTWRQDLPNVIAALKERQNEVIAHDGFTNTFIDALADMEVKHPSIPSDNHDATVSMVYDPTNVEIDWDAAEDYGPGVLRVPFSCESEVVLDFFIFYAEAYSQPDSISVQWADHEQKPFFDAQATAVAFVRGFLSIALQDWQQGDAPKLLEIAVDEIAEIELKENEIGEALM